MEGAVNLTLNIIKNESKKLTKGEMELLNKIRKLYKEYQSEAYLYVQPTISNLIPDFILIDEKRGISILEVKDWSLSYIKDINKRRVILADREDDNKYLSTPISHKRSIVVKASLVCNVDRTK